MIRPVTVVVLADKFALFDMGGIYDLSPVPVFWLGVYFIVTAIRIGTGRSARGTPAGKR